MSTEIRRARIKALVVNAQRDEGLSQTQFAKKHGLDPSHLSQMLTGNRGIGASVTRRIEESLMLERGYLDRPLSDDAKSEVILEATSLLNQMDTKSLERSLEFMKNTLKIQKLESEIPD